MWLQEFESSEDVYDDIDDIPVQAHGMATSSDAQSSGSTRSYDSQYRGSDEEQACSWIADVTGIRVNPHSMQQVNAESDAMPLLLT